MTREQVLLRRETEAGSSSTLRREELEELADALEDYGPEPVGVLVELGPVPSFEDDLPPGWTVEWGHSAPPERRSDGGQPRGEHAPDVGVVEELQEHVEYRPVAGVGRWETRGATWTVSARPDDVVVDVSIETDRAHLEVPLQLENALDLAEHLIAAAEECGPA